MSVSEYGHFNIKPFAFKVLRVLRLGKLSFAFFMCCFTVRVWANRLAAMVSTLRGNLIMGTV